MKLVGDNVLVNDFESHFNLIAINCLFCFILFEAVECALAFKDHLLIPHLMTQLDCRMEQAFKSFSDWFIAIDLLHFSLEYVKLLKYFCFLVYAN